jgi:hypothetical protein
VDSATAAPADPRDELVVGDPPAIGVASIPASPGQARPPAPVPSMPVPPEAGPAGTAPSEGSAPEEAPTGTAPPSIPPPPVRLAAVQPAPTRSVPGVGEEPQPSHGDGALLSDDATSGFSPSVSDKLRSYVYLLVDPRTGRAFAVGRGQGDRCFHHVRAARDGGDPEPGTEPADEAGFPMMERIREVESSGREVRIDILRYGLTTDEASLVEAAVHDALGLRAEPMLGSQRQSAVEVGSRLAKRAKFKRAHQVVLLRVGGRGADPSYEEARHGWRLGRNWLDPDSVRSPRWAVVVVGTLVAAVHRIERWEPARSPVPAPTGGTDPWSGTTGGGPTGRYSFVGPVDPELERRYVGKSVAAYLGKGTPGAITFVWCGPHWVNTPP